MNIFRDFANLALLVLPVSGCYRVKRTLLRLAGVEVGREVKVNGHTWFYGRGRVRIGDRTWIGPGCRFYSTYGTLIEVGADCDLAPAVMLVTGSHELGGGQRRAGTGVARDVIVQSGCWVGARVTLLGGVTVGQGSLIAAGALVNADVTSNTLAAGVPAVAKKELPQ